MNETQAYALEDIRAFLIKRQWIGDILLPDGEFQKLKDRELQLDGNRQDYLYAYIDGYKEAKR